jgi:RimJ/RimL family protein N-acetyltransferase
MRYPARVAVSVTGSHGFETPRLRIVPIPYEDAEAMLHGRRPAEDRWAPDYPTDSTLVAAGVVVTAVAEGRDLGPFGSYQIIRRADEMAVGGCGFVLGGPDEHGCVQVSFSLVGSAEGHGLAPEAMEALIAFAKELPGVRRVVAETAQTNTAGLEVYEQAGMRLAGWDGELVLLEA